MVVFVFFMVLLVTVFWHRVRFIKRGWYTFAALFVTLLLWIWFVVRASVFDVPYVVVLFARAVLVIVRVPFSYLLVVIVMWGQFLIFGGVAWVLMIGLPSSAAEGEELILCDGDDWQVTSMG